MRLIRMIRLDELLVITCQNQSEDNNLSKHDLVSNINNIRILKVSTYIKNIGTVFVQKL